ncbi:hypothetical protein FOZG_14479 [Fusarium oxysporum Fo47]|uniref:Uncharacterized protein n=1 Tax=Fusarium oxysporum Fo47 TaxID=660027 RepID=W9JR44_FUSOX|nr:hypothetical protein FOZG_14479 [Fusarium oxysporum Fo47]
MAPWRYIEGLSGSGDPDGQPNAEMSRDLVSIDSTSDHPSESEGV